MRVWAALFTALLVGACTGVPANVTPVDDFDVEKYLGKWYEIARLDHAFERGLDKVTAQYALRGDGGVQVLNRGFSSEDGEWKEAEGKAYFVGSRERGHLKVSFFGPFYSSYVVFGLDRTDYQHAFVCGYNKSYLWLLARTPTVSQALVDEFLRTSRELGFDTSELQFVEHDSGG